jgi:hypothetical protein
VIIIEGRTDNSPFYTKLTGHASFIYFLMIIALLSFSASAQGLLDDLFKTGEKILDKAGKVEDPADLLDAAAESADEIAKTGLKTSEKVLAACDIGR